MLKISSSILACTLALAATGCPKKGADATGGGTTPGPAAPTTAWAGNMAEAPLHELGTTVAATPMACRETHYAKWNLPQGQAAKMTVTIEGPAGACASVAYLKGNGGNVDGMMKELCIDKNPSETWDITGGGRLVHLAVRGRAVPGPQPDDRRAVTNDRNAKTAGRAMPGRSCVCRCSET